MAEPSERNPHNKSLDHIRAARKSIRRPPPPTTPPAAIRRPAADQTSSPTDDTGYNPKALEPTERPVVSEREPDLTIEKLAASIDALTAKYEMEQAAHRQTLDQLIAQQQAHIETLQRLLEQRSETDA